MGQLVALDLPAGQEFVDALRAEWANDNAVLPVDQRLPQMLQRDLIERMGASRVVSPSGTTDLDGGEPVESGDALVVPTSGSTGQPKGVVLTHDAVIASAKLTNAALNADRAADGWLCCLPLSHVGGLSVVTRALHCGIPLVVHEQFDTEAVETAAAQGSTLVSLVVTALGRVDASLFRKILLGGSAIPAQRPQNTVATYGMTETGSGVVYDGWALPGVDLRVVDDQIELRSPTLLRTYRNGFDPRKADGWFPTGDLGELSDVGKLSVFGRKGDVIVTGGEKVWPASLEARLRTRNDIDEVVVVGRPDPEWGQAVTYVIQPTDANNPPTLDKLRTQLADSEARHALPKAVELVTTFERTASGKVIRDRV